MEKKMLSKMPDDKLKELEESLKKQIEMEIIYGQELQERSDLIKKGGNHGNNKKTRQLLSD